LIYFCHRILLFKLNPRMICSHLLPHPVLKCTVLRVRVHKNSPLYFTRKHRHTHRHRHTHSHKPSLSLTITHTNTHIHTYTQTHTYTRTLRIGKSYTTGEAIFSETLFFCKMFEWLVNAGEQMKSK